MTEREYVSVLRRARACLVGRRAAVHAEILVIDHALMTKRTRNRLERALGGSA